MREYWDYNNAGQVWRTNAGDGVDRIVVYDGMGNATLEVRNSGVAGDFTVDSKTAQSAALGTFGKRTVSKYDALGRLVEQKLPTRYEAEGGVAVSHMNASAKVLGSAKAAVSHFTHVAWSPENQVELTWKTLAGLGPGDVKVQVSYLTKFELVAGDIPRKNDGIQLTPDEQLPGERNARVATQVFSGGDAESGVKMHWPEEKPC